MSDEPEFRVSELIATSEVRRGWLEVAAIVTSDSKVGTVLEVQFPATFQVVLIAPVQAIELSTEIVT